ncbi:hypothetical protein AB7M74_001778 [Bradyrhizobium japonicum]
MHRPRQSKAQFERLLQEQERERQLREWWGLLKPAAKHKRKRRPGSGRRPKFKSHQQAWLQVQYRLDLNAIPRLAKRDAAVPHVRKLAETEFTIHAGRDTLLEHIIRPVLPEPNGK